MMIPTAPAPAAIFCAGGCGRRRTGTLKEGQIKFPLDKSQGTFVGDCVVAKADNTPIGTELDFDIENLPKDPGALDRKWFVSADQAGTYTVRLDFGTKKISFTKQ